MAQALADFNFFDPTVQENPFAFYQAALSEAPVYHLPGTAIYLVSSFDLVAQVCGAPERFSNNFSALLTGRGATDPEIKAVLDTGWPQVNTLLTNDPPSHGRFRKLVNLAFSAPKVNAMEAQVRDITRALIAEIAERGTCNFVDDFAVKLPVAVIAQVLGDGPAEMAMYKRWSDAFTDRLGGMASHARELECAHEVVEFQRYFKTRIDACRADPSLKNMTADLVHARIDGEQPLDDAEILSIVQQIMVAGNETTTNTMAGALLLLIQHPDQLAKLQADPGLIPNMVEEVLRLEAATAGMWRVATADTELGGVAIPAGAMVHVRYAAANRDPAKFADPDAFDVTRTNARTHMAFGKGIHMCVGNMLSRKELTVAFQELLTALDGFHLLEGNTLTHTPSLMLRGLQALHIGFNTRTDTRAA